MTYMLKIGQTFYARIVIPIDLQFHFHCRELKRSLKTKSRKEAKQLLIKTLHEWQSQFFQLRYILPMDQRPPSAEALEIFKRKYPNLSPEPKTFLGAFDIPKQHWPAELMHIMDILEDPRKLQAVPPATTTIINNNNRTYNGLGTPAQAPTQVTPYVPQLTVKEAADAWLSSKEVTSLDGKIRGTQDTYRKRIRKLTEPYGDRPLEEINDYQFLDDFVNDEIRRHKKTYRKSILTIITQMIHYHHQLTRKADPSKRISTPPEIKIQEDAEEKFNRKSSKPNPSYNTDQLQILFDSFASKPAKRVSSTVDRRIHIITIYATLIALYTGFRISDLKHLRASDFNFDEPVPNISQENRLVEEIQFDGKVALSNTNKTATSLKLPLHKHLLSLKLDKFISMFKSDELPFEKDSTISQRLKAQLEANDIKQDGQLMHAFRTTVDSKHIALGTPLPIKEFLLSHALIGTRKSYNDPIHLSKHELPEINPHVQKLDYRLDFTALKAHLEQQLSFFV